MLIHPDRLFPAESPARAIARTIYQHVRALPIGGGWLPAPFRRLGLSSNYARLAAMLFCACLVVPIYTASSVRSEWSAIALISIAAGAHQGWSANLFTTPSDMFPRSAVGSVIGIGGIVGSAGSAVFSFFAGHVLQLPHSYASLFGIAASAHLLALIALCLLGPGLKKAEFIG
jgi:ACS family hexuronate transporter-like MFS transporter